MEFQLVPGKLESESGKLETSGCDGSPVGGNVDDGNTAVKEPEFGKIAIEIKVRDTLKEAQKEFGEFEPWMEPEIQKPLIVQMDSSFRIKAECVPGEEINVLIDTGADISIGDKQLALSWLQAGSRAIGRDRIKGEVGLQTSNYNSVALPNGEELCIIGTMNMAVRMARVTFAIQPQFVSPLRGLNLVLGRDFLCMYGTHIDSRYMHLIFTPKISVIVPQECKIRSGQSVVLQMTTSLNIPDGVTGIVHGISRIERPHEIVKILLGNVVSQFQHGNIAVQLANPNPHSIRLFPGELIGYFEPVVGLDIPEEQQRLWSMYIPKHYKCEEGTLCMTPEGKNSVSGTSSTKAVASEPVKVDLSQSCLNLEQKQEVANLLQEFRDVFVGSDGIIGCTDMIEHHIRTEPGTHPIASKPYRVNYKNRRVIEEQVQEMLDQKIIRPSASPWSAPVVLVPKRDGTLRFCVDYRRLNKITVLEQFPLPDIRQSLEIFGSKNARYFSTLDLKSAYWNVKLCEHSVEKSAFITPTGLWEFVRLPFGLSGAPMCFSRLMSEVLRGMLWEVCLVYLDDIIIFSCTVEEHLVILREVLERLRRAKLKLAASKCYLFREEVKFLGHYVSAKGIRVDPKKVEAVRNYPIPTNVTQVRAFLGLAGYYRRFCKNYAEVAKPLTEMTRNENAEPFGWGERQQQAFEKLKIMLTTTPLLAYPDPNKPYRLYTDASQLSVGYVLCQEQEGVEKVICYGGKQLSDVEQKSGITELEFLAVCYAIEDCKCYLLGTEFVVITDHAALKGFIKNSEPNAKLARRILALQPYRFSIEYRPGRKHGNADALSRRSYDQEGIGLESPELAQALTLFQYQGNLSENRLNRLPFYANSRGSFVYDHTMAQQQEQDPMIRPYYVFHTSGEIHNCEKRVGKMILQTRDEFILKGRILYHLWVRPGSGAVCDRTIEQLVLPREYKERVLKEYHDSGLAGHRRFSSTYMKIRLRYWWPDMGKEIQNWCDSCQACTQSDRSKQRRNVPLMVSSVSGPFEHLHVDIVGKLTLSQQGNSYILSMIDSLTRWVELVALPNQEGLTVARTVFEVWICRFGAPRQITSDRGTNFLSVVFKFLSDKFGIDRVITSAYTPKSNGVLERRHADIVASLKRLVGNEPSTWDEFLPAVRFATNTLVCSSTGLSPFELVFGRMPHLPIDLSLPVPEVSGRGMQGQIHTLQYKLQVLEKLASERDHLMKSRYKAYYDKKAGKELYNVGDKCWVYSPGTNTKLGAGKKLINSWVGPYQISKIVGVNVQLKRCHDDLPVQRHVHVNRIKPFIARHIRPAPPPLEITGLMEQGFDLSPQDIPADEITGEVVEDFQQVSKTGANRIDEPEVVPVEQSVEADIGDFYEVEDVLKGRIRKDGRKEVLLKWLGFSKPTWELLSNVNDNLLDLIAQRGLFPEMTIPTPLRDSGIVISDVESTSVNDKSQGVHKTNASEIIPTSVDEVDLYTSSEKAKLSDTSEEINDVNHPPPSSDQVKEVLEPDIPGTKEVEKEEVGQNKGQDAIAYRTRSRVKVQN